MKAYPYVYKVVNRITGEFYIGYREANRKKAELDIISYKTSSTKVRPIFDQFECFIIAEFFTETSGSDAYWFEQELIKENINDILCLNQYYIENNGINKKFKQRKGRKNSEESNLKISKAKSVIDPNTGLQNAQQSAIKAHQTIRQNGGYRPIIEKANATKIKNNSNAIGGKKCQITKKTKIDEETGLTIGKAAAIKSTLTQRKIDPETGMSIIETRAKKCQITKKTKIDEETGLTIGKAAGLKLKESLKKIDPNTGLTLKQMQTQKQNITKSTNGSIKGKNNPMAKIVSIYNSDGKLMFKTNGDFYNVCKDNNLPYHQLGESYRSDGKPVNSKKFKEFTGWFAIISSE